MKTEQTTDQLILWAFKWDVRRMGEVTGIFDATREAVKAAIGKDVYFGEILGKHSEIYGTLDEGDLTELTDDQKFIQQAKDFKCIPVGYNPLDYLSEEAA